MSAPPTAFRWDDLARVMVPTHPRLASARFDHDTIYLLGDVEDRSDISHNHEFAWLKEAWNSRPEHLSEAFQSAAHLRKAALIKAGFRDERSVVCGSRAEALRVAAFIRPMDEYAVVSVSGATVVVLTAKSQSKKAMGKDEFQRSKTAIMDVVAEMLGISVDQLPAHEAA